MPISILMQHMCKRWYMYMYMYMDVLHVGQTLQTLNLPDSVTTFIGHWSRFSEHKRALRGTSPPVRSRGLTLPMLLLVLRVPYWWWLLPRRRLHDIARSQGRSSPGLPSLR